MRQRREPTPRISKFGDILDHRDHDSLLRMCVTEATLPHKRRGTNPASHQRFACTQFSDGAGLLAHPFGCLQRGDVP